MMATYFNGGSEIQADNLQKLYLVNPSCYAATYSDDQQPQILNPGTVHHAPHHLVGIPLAHSGSGSPVADLSRPSSFHEVPISAEAAHRLQYSHWAAAYDVSELGSPMEFKRQGLSLSLNNSSPADKNEAVVPTMTSGSGSSQTVILGSKYLKAAQQLLDEVVNMADSGSVWAHREKAKAAATMNDEVDGAGSGDKKGGCEALSSAQRQELQMKKSKLLNMLDEVEQRYKQYEMQMQRLAWALEQAAGAGSRKSYTWLALRTISKQFRCLKDAIVSQVKDTGRKLGEDDEEGPRTSTRARMVEQQLRQQRTLHQLGMMHNQHNAWRPQRGLPVRAVSILRAWLFEHFLHPYPKDSDKHMLAKQTGLARRQVSNWFINARVRLWKPMVEEMYVEEMKGAAHPQNAVDSGHANNNDNNSINDIPNSTLISPQPGSTGPSFSHIGSPSSAMESSILIQRSPKRQRNSPSNNSDFFTTTNGGFRPNSCPVADPIVSRFNPDHHHNDQLGQSRYHHFHARNSVSLTLGLPHGAGAHHPEHNFLSGQAMQMRRTLDMGEHGWCPAQPIQQSDGGGGYDSGVDIQTRKRFATQLLPDFVA